MAEDETQQSSTDTDAPAGTDDKGEAADEGSGESTPADIEAYWKKRQSNSDKANAAAQAVMQKQIADLTKAPDGNAAAGDSQAAAALAAANKRADDAEAAASAANIAAKYPNAAKAVGRAVVVMGEAELASLETTLDFEAKAPRITDNNNPARPTAEGVKSVEDMSLAELKVYFKTVPVSTG